eukprot:COSAG05_NODE_1543_length_4591_cov_1.921416_2_plen_96_part_00
MKCRHMAQVLVVDEVSMLSGEFLELLDQAVTSRRAECILRTRNTLVRTHARASTPTAHSHSFVRSLITIDTNILIALCGITAATRRAAAAAAAGR